MTNFDELLAGGSTSAFNKNSVVGETVTGPIVSATSRQVTDFKTKAPETWDNGDPKMQAVITIKTSLRRDEHDDGARSVYVKLWGLDKQALSQAIREAGFTSANAALAAGNIFTATFTGTQPSKYGSDQKLYAYQIQRGAVGMDQALQAPPVQQYAAPAQQPPAAPQYAQATPTPQQVVPAAAPVQPSDMAGMIQAGWGDDQIAQATGATSDVIAMVRANLPH